MDLLRPLDLVETLINTTKSPNLEYVCSPAITKNLYGIFYLLGAAVQRLNFWCWVGFRFLVMDLYLVVGIRY